MVFDVVASRQRRYEQRVLPMVERFARSDPARSLHALATCGPQASGLRNGEAETMQEDEAALVRFGQDHGLADDDAIAREWALSVADLEHAHDLDPYVGGCKGIGTALFAYLRMRSGADA